MGKVHLENVHDEKFGAKLTKEKIKIGVANYEISKNRNRRINKI